MSARLEATDATRRSFLAEVTHELRTPLAIIRGQAEGITDGVYAAEPGQITPILEATHSLEVPVEDLRTLALSKTGSLTLTREPGSQSENRSRPAADSGPHEPRRLA